MIMSSRLRVVLADLTSGRGAFRQQGHGGGAYGSRLSPFSRVTSIIAHLNKQFHDVPSVHMARRPSWCELATMSNGRGASS
jgi:hypothetical protein